MVVKHSLFYCAREELLEDLDGKMFMCYLLFFLLDLRNIISIPDLCLLQFSFFVCVFRKEKKVLNGVDAYVFKIQHWARGNSIDPPFVGLQAGKDSYIIILCLYVEQQGMPS